MRLILPCLFVLTACAVDVESPRALPADALPASFMSFVDAPTQIVPGTTIELHIQSDVLQGEEVVLAFGTSGLGVGRCPAVLGGACVDVANARVGDRALADAAGDATFVVTIPPGIAPGTVVGLQAVFPQGSSSVIGEAIEVTVVAPPQRGVNYLLKTSAGGASLCLDGNDLASGRPNAGAYMAPCDGSPDQAWRILDSVLPSSFQLHNVASLGANCLEGNQAGSNIEDGAAFLNDCTGVTGQLWMLEGDNSNPGHYLLKTVFRGDGECLDANAPAATAHGGAAYMELCSGSGDQAWDVVEAP